MILLELQSASIDLRQNLLIGEDFTRAEGSKFQVFLRALTADVCSRGDLVNQVLDQRDWISLGIGFDQIQPKA